MKFMIIDGNSLINRAFYGVRPLSTKEGIHTNAIFGFLNTYFKLLEEEKPQNACVCFDLKAPTFRHLQYEGYKATRKGMPEELAMQMPYIKEILDALGVPRMEKEGFEADDLLGTISKSCENRGIDCTVVTGDKDSLQLIGEKTRVAIVSTRMVRPPQRNSIPKPSVRSTAASTRLKSSTSRRLWVIRAITFRVLPASAKRALWIC